MDSTLNISKNKLEVQRLNTEIAALYQTTSKLNNALIKKDEELKQMEKRLALSRLDK